MDESLWSTVTGIAALVALVVAAVAAKFTRDQRDSARDSVKVANAATEASERQASAAEEQLNIMRAERADALDLRAAQPTWAIEHHSGDLYILTNVGGREVMSVTVTPPPNSSPSNLRSCDRVAAGGSIEVITAATEATPGPASCVVEWLDAAHSDAPETQRLILPPKSR
ncbi:hypothetical protein [Cellulomonas dongxiuzhuiae]|uniref:Secreted protein n=1 Tax=Cellulomonas dongxiuzhuiae TaxID=2819979 RepID=A0ABX8GNS5_9CELL|nr:hypothetical protein [Cellulomonas dongxiuzhuiae]MBO3095845.1 hypothetical protein [Cellulomonas dongxiuzhuiae]QWC17151.1 hypothetical protein KKR89_05995 [Cellulomonas dongxiuzhuiae]